MKKILMLCLVLGLVLVFSGCGDTDSKVVDEPTTTTVPETTVETTPDTSDNQITVDSGAGEIQAPSLVEEAELKPVGTYTGSGTATRASDDMIFTHTVDAEIGDPAEGKFYGGWLTKGDGSSDIIFTGKLQKIMDNYYQIVYREVKENQLDYDNIVITEDIIEGTPGSHVLEGSF